MPNLEAAIGRMEAVIEKQNENIDKLVQQVGILVGTMTTFAKALNNRPTKRQFYFLGITLLAILGFMALSVQANNTVAHRIQDCTDPQGECAKRGQEGTAIALLQIKCGEVNLINELAEKNSLAPVSVPDECKVFEESSGG